MTPEATFAGCAIAIMAAFWAALLWGVNRTVGL